MTQILKSIVNSDMNYSWFHYGAIWTFIILRILGRVQALLEANHTVQCNAAPLRTVPGWVHFISIQALLWKAYRCLPPRYSMHSTPGCDMLKTNGAPYRFTFRHSLRYSLVRFRMLWTTSGGGPPWHASTARFSLDAFKGPSCTVWYRYSTGTIV